MSKIKRLFLDLETTPNVGYFWQSGYKLNIPYENIIGERAIICVGFKWQGDKEVQILKWDSKQNDKKLVEKIVKIIEQADEVVAHNGDAFDIPWIRARAVIHGIPLAPQVKTVDTLKWAKSYFKFNSNRLDYLSKILGIGGKIKTEFQLWIDVMNNKKAALEEMLTYCKHDVNILEKVFKRLESYAPVKTHGAVLHGGQKSDCPACSSTNTDKHPLGSRHVTPAGAVQIRMQCKECARVFRVAETTFKRERVSSCK